MAPRLTETLQKVFTRSSNNGPDGVSAKHATALVTGSVALGALITSAVLEKTRRTKFPLPEQLPNALPAEVGEMEIMEGRARYYKRAGTGVPIVLLHSINAAGSSFEMKPLFDHLAATTERPIYALDWLGFGRSDRPPVRYSPGLYQRQLRRFLSEHIRLPSDVIALSLACEYAATVANAFPILIRRLVCIAPTALGKEDEGSLLQRALVAAASGIGAFEIFFTRLTERGTLRRFYEQEVFLPGSTVPQDLLDYAYATTHIRGAHHAPRWFVEGTLFMNEYARRAYTHLQIPTLFVVPTSSSSTIQDFERASEVAGANPDHIRMQTVAAGLLPQWENLEALFEALDPFLSLPAREWDGEPG